MTPERERILAEIAAIVCAENLVHPTRVAIDGVTASGKTTLARELAAAVAAAGRSAIHLSLDDFHHPRAHRHRRGRHSAEGYYEDAYDVAGFAAAVLVPLGPGGDRRYRPRIHDLASDATIDEAPVEAPADAVLVVDGSFLLRPELAGLWDVGILVEASPAVARERGTRRDAALLGGLAEAERLYDARYLAAWRLHAAAGDPTRLAMLVVENDDPARPRLRRTPPDRRPGRRGGGAASTP